MLSLISRHLLVVLLLVAPGQYGRLFPVVRACAHPTSVAFGRATQLAATIDGISPNVLACCDGSDSSRVEKDILTVWRLECDAYSLLDDKRPGSVHESVFVHHWDEGLKGVVTLIRGPPRD